MEKIIPQTENEGKGFHYSISDEALAKRREMSVREILNCVEETAKFIYMVQTPEERVRMRKFNNGAF